MAGGSGSGKTTVARRIGAVIGAPHTEIDSLFHGPGWTERGDFERDVLALVARPRWVTEYQYARVRPVLLARADLVVGLLLPRRVVMAQLVLRTVSRRLRRVPLWNDNREPPLRAVLTDRDHIVRWGWRSHGRAPGRLDEMAAARPDLPVVVLRSRREIREWLSGPLSRAADAG